MITSLFLNAGMGLLAGSAISGSALKEDVAVAEVKEAKLEVVAAVEKSIPVSLPPVTKLKKDKHGMLTYSDSQRRRHVRTTSYSHMENEKGVVGRQNAISTNLVYTKKHRSAAADWSVYPVGTKFKIKGQSQIYTIDDYGSALVGTNTIDIYKPSLRAMRQWGTRHVDITVIEWGSYERSRKILSHRCGYKHCRKMHNAIVKKLESGKYAAQ